MLSSERHWRELRKKAKRGKSGFPVASLAFYGPNAEFATKVAVGVILNPVEGAMHVERWYSTTVDVRKNQDVALKILTALNALKVKQIAILERISGCPHEDGEDYPRGESCPFCLYWKNRDRVTHEINGQRDEG